MSQPPMKLDPREEHFRIAGPNARLRLFVRRLSAPVASSAHRTPVLYVHGGTFPSALSIAHRFDGLSWRDVLHEAGFDVWAFDFQGFGNSDRYVDMAHDASAHPPLCDARDGAAQVEAVARFVLRQTGAARLSLVSHSWGSMPAGRFAGARPGLVERWVLFGPIARRDPPPGEAPRIALPAWRIVTIEDQWRRFIEDVPPDEPPVLLRRHFDAWAECYLDTDEDSRARESRGVKIPAGPSADILRAHHGALGYDPALVQAPVAIIRGAWDGVFPDLDARWLFDAFTSSTERRDVKIGRATHLMHLETMRTALYSETNAFLLEGQPWSRRVAA